jgi:putative oxidoreductase
MKKILFNKYFILSLRLVIGFIFIYASIWKIAHPEEFAKSIDNYRLMPIFTINLIALFLPWLELLIGLFIIFGIMIKTSSLLLIFNMSVFCIVILLAIIRNLDIECGCFSSVGSPSAGWSKFFEDIALLAAAIIIYISGNNEISIEKYYSRISEKRAL